jgi:hypothetical protein
LNYLRQDICCAAVNALGFTAGQEEDVAQCSGGLLLYQLVGEVNKNVLAVLAAAAKILDETMLV